MKVIAAAFGHIVLLMPEELRVPAVADEISVLKKTGKVAILVSGSENAAEVLCKLLKSTV